MGALDQCYSSHHILLRELEVSCKGSLAKVGIMQEWGKAHEGVYQISLSPSALLPGSPQVSFPPTSSSLLLIFFLFLRLLAKGAARLTIC